MMGKLVLVRLSLIYDGYVKVDDTDEPESDIPSGSDMAKAKDIIGSKGMTGFEKVIHESKRITPSGVYVKAVNDGV